MHLKWPKVFYGWCIVGAVFLLALYTAGAVSYGFTAFFKPLTDEFGWSYTQISLAASLRGLEIGLLAPLAGIVIDRWGPRRLIFGGIIVIGLGLILLSRTTTLGMFYGAFALVGLGASACSNTVLITTVANWFHRKAGTAIGIAFCGFGFGGFLVPVVVRLIDIYGWRTAIFILAIGVLAIGLPLSFLMRHKPEHYGYLPDGALYSTVIASKNSSPPQTVEVNIGAKQAMKSRTFWHIALAHMCRMLMLSAVITHVMPYLSSIGITRAMSGLVAGAIPVASIGGRFSFGWLADRMDKRKLAAIGFTFMSLGMLLFGWATSEDSWRLVPFFILFGIGYGGINTVSAALVREHFGRSKFGSIYGAVIGIMWLGNVSGAPLGGFVFDTWGNYQPLWFVFAFLSIVALVIVATIPQFERPVEIAEKPRAAEGTF